MSDTPEDQTTQSPTAIERVDIDPIHSAIVDAACLAMLADGQVHELETEHMMRFVTNLLRVDADVAVLLIQDSARRIERQPLEEFIQELGQRVQSREDQEQLLIAVLFSSYADGEVTIEEESLFFAIADTFEVDDDDLEEIVERANFFYDQLIDVYEGRAN